MKKIVFVTASPETVSAFLLAYINALSAKHDMHVATNMSNHENIRGLSPEIKIHHVAIARDPKIWSDLCALKTLFSLFKQQNFDVVHSFTPKAGLLSQLSAFMARSPFRFHTFTGQVWATKSGLSRTLLKSLDKVTASLATYCLVDSPSQQNFLIQENLLSQNNSKVLAQGSISGVDIEKFTYCPIQRQQLRQLHNVDDNDFIFLFVGRLKVDKGIPELIDAFKQLKTQQNIKLFLIGSDEDNLQSLFTGCENIHYIGFKTNVADYYAFADMLCLPSHREGFGNVIIEAASCNLPAIAANIYGLSDAVENGYSGLLHTVKDISSITQCMEKVIDNKAQTQEMRVNARIRVENTFAEAILVNEFISFYDNMLK